MILIERSEMLEERRFTELREFAVRDIDQIAPGDEVLFVHLPQRDGNYSDLYWSTPTVNRVTVQSIGPGKVQEIYNGHYGTELFDEEQIVVVYTDSRDQQYYRYASDSGLMPYGQGAYNSSNFTLSISELEAQGIKPSLEIEPELEREIKRHNDRLNRRSRRY